MRVVLVQMVVIGTKERKELFVAHNVNNAEVWIVLKT